MRAAYSGCLSDPRTRAASPTPRAGVVRVRADHGSVAEPAHAARGARDGEDVHACFREQKVQGVKSFCHVATLLEANIIWAEEARQNCAWVCASVLDQSLPPTEKGIRMD